MAFLAIVATENNRISKYMDFDSQPEADAHVATYGGFVYDNATNHPIKYLDVQGQTVTEIAPPTPAEIDAAELQKAKDRLDAALQQVRSFDLAVGKVLFDHENRLRVLEGSGTVTAPQFRNAFKDLID